MYLRKKGTDEYFSWTELLAARSDMEMVKTLPLPVSPAAVAPAPEPPAPEPEQEKHPDPDDWSAMTERKDLQAFARDKLGLVLDSRLGVDRMKQAIGLAMLERAGTDTGASETAATQ